MHSLALSHSHLQWLGLGSSVANSKTHLQWLGADVSDVYANSQEVHAHGPHAQLLATQAQTHAQTLHPLCRE